MKLINANIDTDLSYHAINAGLSLLASTDLSHVKLLTSSSYSFQDIYNIINKEYFLKNQKFSYDNVDTSEILLRDSWMLIDYSLEKIYYSPGA